MHYSIRSLAAYICTTIVRTTVWYNVRRNLYMVVHRQSALQSTHMCRDCYLHKKDE